MDLRIRFFMVEQLPKIKNTIKKKKHSTGIHGKSVKVDILFHSKYR